MKESRPSLIKLINQLYRFTQSYTDEVFGKYELSSGMYPFLIALSRNEGINQNQISRELGVDKAMSARTVKKLIELGYITKKSDAEDSRAYNLFLTDKSRNILPEIFKGINGWIDEISSGVDEIEREKVVDTLSILLNNAKNIRNKRSDREV